ncbi:hypothetical protein CHISP_2231 [Chitinispirillum alkaliphilum]|nr:hypothetical protein CHISP_2231 [Chitinispirillum alkaliphilum]
MNAPIGAVGSEQVLTVEWSGTVRDELPLDPSFRAPDSGRIFFDLYPGGSDLSNYRYEVDVAWEDYDNYHIPGTPPRRGIQFRPTDQEDMGTGVYYCIVAWPMESDTLYSNEFQIMVESPDPVDWESPSGRTANLTPVFRWNANPGVPYYHVIMSDEAIKIDESSGTVNLEGVSVVWQAITPNTSITYGSPDPSGTITADPPPLSPGQRYTWMVLNNYGNHPAFSSQVIKLPPGEFTIEGEPLERPVNVYPVNEWNLTSVDNEKFSFKWTNLDPAANTYQIYVYAAADSLIDGLGEDISAKIAVWQKTVSAQKDVDTMSVEIEASSILTSNKYAWRVIAIDDRGAGSGGELSEFSYYVPTGTMNVFTREKLIMSNGESLDTVINRVGLVEITMDVLDGPMESALLFYTNHGGDLVRTRPAGTYRLTAVKEGYESLSRTVELGDGDVTFDTLYMTRPASTVFGRVKDQTGSGINLATVRAISDRNDTVEVRTDSRGSFVLNCYGADWWISARKTGYRESSVRKITLGDGQNFNFGAVELQVNEHTLSGNVKNNNNDPVLGARVRLFQNGNLVDQVSSTPQDGSYSFSVEPGNYTLKADRAGFTSYTREVTLTGSRTISITLNPGAAMVAGRIIGRTWSNSRQDYVYAPIRQAQIQFIDTQSPSQKITVYSDATYGNYSVSLAGNKNYKVIASAPGFSSMGESGLIETVPFTTHTHNDTLQRKATISGNVRMIDGQPVSGVSLSLSDTSRNVTVVSGQSGSNGIFELNRIPDGEYELRAGRDGLVVNNFSPSGSVTVVEGRAMPNDFEIMMEAGEKTIKWVVEDYEGSGSVKVQSPFLRNISFQDSLTNAGPGVYIFQADADSDSIIDLSFRRVEVPVDVQTFTDTFSLGVSHASPDTLIPENGSVSLTLRSVNVLDSAVIYYRNRGTSSFESQTLSEPDSSYIFTFVPRENGTDLIYYFQAFSGNDVYGYAQEVFTAFVKPDTTRLSRIEIFPFSEQIVSLPISYEVEFSLRGYYASSFIPAGNLSDDAIAWELINAQGSRLQSNTGTKVNLRTSNSGSTDTVWLRVTIDTTEIGLVPGLSEIDSVGFVVTGSRIGRIGIARIDNRSPDPITTSRADRAVFRATGFDSKGNRLDVVPNWSISPVDAGIISKEGVFRPSENFVGHVRVFASVGSVTGEYSPYNRNENVLDAGLPVRYILRHKDRADTADTRKGCVLIFPKGVLREGESGLIEIKTPDTRNQVKRGFGNVRMVDSIAYEISQLESVRFRDSVTLVLGIPQEFRELALTGERDFWIARWDRDSLQWNILENSVVSSAGEAVSANVAHFSKFAVVSQPRELSAKLEISPNPFSPFIRPVNEYGQDARFGTCIRYRIEAPEQRVASARINIFNNVGDRVWAVEHLNASSGEHRIWWDGRTTSREEVFRDGAVGELSGINQGRMLRNGRYFVVLTVRDINGKEVQHVRQVILMK